MSWRANRSEGKYARASAAYGGRLRYCPTIDEEQDRLSDK